MSDFEDGDIVTVTMARNDVFPWQRSCRFQGHYRRGPRGAGDTIRIDVPTAGVTLSLNGNSSEFVAIHKEENDAPLRAEETDGGSDE